MKIKTSPFDNSCAKNATGRIFKSKSPLLTQRTREKWGTRLLRLCLPLSVTSSLTITLIKIPGLRRTLGTEYISAGELKDVHFQNGGYAALP
jgi:hypothetical protein